VLVDLIAQRGGQRGEDGVGRKEVRVRTETGQVELAVVTVDTQEG